MEKSRALICYEETVAVGAYESSETALYRKFDHVRRIWEDQLTRNSLGEFLLPLLDNGTLLSSSPRVLDLGCGAGEGIEVLTQLRRPAVGVTAAPPETLFPRGPGYYKGVDLSPAMITKGRERYAYDPRYHFEVADLNGGLPHSKGEEPYDIYFSSYGALSHLPDISFRRLLEDICDHMGRRAILVADLLGRYSYEWPLYWDTADSGPTMRPYSMAYVYPPEQRVPEAVERFPVRHWGGEEFDRFLGESVTGKGVQVVRSKRVDRSVLVGRHMDTREFNPNAPPLRSVVNSLHTPRQRTDLSQLLFNYRPHPRHPRINEHFRRIQTAWNSVVQACIQALDRGCETEAGLTRTVEEQPEAVGAAVRTLQHAIREAGGFRMGDPVANLIEPQLGYLLRDLEQALQQGRGAAHGLLAFYELEKEPTR